MNPGGIRLQLTCDYLPDSLGLSGHQNRSLVQSSNTFGLGSKSVNSILLDENLDFSQRANLLRALTTSFSLKASDRFLSLSRSRFSELWRRESPLDVVIGAPQSFTWLTDAFNGSKSSSARLSSILVEPRDQIPPSDTAIWLDSCAISPLNVTTSRMFSWLNGYGVPVDSHFAFALASLYFKVCSRDVIDTFSNGQVCNQRLLSIQIAMAIAPRLIDWSKDLHYERCWRRWDRAHLASISWPADLELLTGFNKPLGHWRLASVSDDQ